MNCWIGTSGFSYPAWVGKFYPPGTKSNQMLGAYCRHFPLVELNFSFYQVPTPRHLTLMARQTPPGFQFVVKLHHSLSHDRDAAALDHFRSAVDSLAQAGKLKGLLAQFPQATHFTAGNRQWIEMLAEAFCGLSMAVEFRHRSWYRPEVPDWLHRHQLDVVAVDVPDLPGLYPRGLVVSGRRAYVRLHSRDARLWYGDDGGRYDYDYRDEELAEWIENLRQTAVEEVMFLFNNCQRALAALNARRMKELLAERAPEWDVVAPQSLVQPTLFDWE